MARGRATNTPTRRDNSLVNREQSTQENGAVQPVAALGQEQFRTIMDHIHSLSEAVRTLRNEVQDKRHAPTASRGSRRTRMRKDRQPVESQHHSLKGSEVWTSRRRESKRNRSEGKRLRPPLESLTDFTLEDRRRYESDYEDHAQKLNRIEKQIAEIVDQ